MVGRPGGEAGESLGGLEDFCNPGALESRPPVERGGNRSRRCSGKAQEERPGR